MSPGAAEAGALLARAGAEHRAGRRAAARALVEQALALAPDFGAAWMALATIRHEEGEHESALAALDRALAVGVERPHETQQFRALLFADHLRRDEEARAALEAALRAKPDHLPALMNLGNLHEQRGDREAAIACYRRALDEPRFAAVPDAPLRGVALARIAVMQPPASPDDPLLGQLRAAIDATAEIPSVRVHLQFALGHALDRLQDADGAFDAFARGNRTLLRQFGRRYDRRNAERLTEALVQAFPERPARGEAADATAGPEPLFICGLFRSGSTLLEQVLTGHPALVAGGELDWLPRLAAERMAPFPASARGLDDDRAAALAREYREHLAALFPASATARFVTDKRPDNYELIGLIKRLFPRAKFIHTVRHPMDNGLSVYMQHMNLEVVPYANDLGDIGHHIGQYRRLMAHWEALFPGDIHAVAYEDLVRDPRATIAGALRFLGLDWDERCLAFHERRNTVKTASYWQVRRPLYGEADGRWRRYRGHLAPLENALREAGVDPRTGD